jgi:hypothetical protein
MLVKATTPYESVSSVGPWVSVVVSDSAYIYASDLAIKNDTAGIRNLRHTPKRNI